MTPQAPPPVELRFALKPDYRPWEARQTPVLLAPELQTGLRERLAPAPPRPELQRLPRPWYRHPVTQTFIMLGLDFVALRTGGSVHPGSTWNTHSNTFKFQWIDPPRDLGR